LIGLLPSNVARISANGTSFVIRVLGRLRGLLPRGSWRATLRELEIDREQETAAAGSVSRLSTVVETGPSPQRCLRVGC